MNEVIGYVAALLMGATLGMIGGGGSILTVPIFVYLFSIQPTLATAYSLFVVGLTALFGSFSFMKRNLVDFRAVILFGLPSLVAVYCTRRFIMPAIPETLVSIGEFEVTKNMLIMTVFASVMLIASLSMIRSSRKDKKGQTVHASEKNLVFIILDGLIVGAVTGFVGAGGGFLIVPALIFALKLDMKRAVGTSLCVIAIKSLIGFLGDLQNHVIDWNFLLIFSSLAIVGILVGSAFNDKVPAAKLKPIFGYFVLIAGVGILLRETLFS